MSIESLELYMKVQGFSEEEKKKARDKFSSEGEYTHGSSRFLSTVSNAAKPPVKKEGVK